MRLPLIACLAIATLVACVPALRAQPVEEGARVVLEHRDSTLVGGMLIAIDSTSIALRTALDDTLRVRLVDLDRVTLITPRPSIGSAAVVLGLQTAYVVTHLINRPDRSPLDNHGRFLLATIPGLAVGGLVGLVIDGATRQPRVELDASDGNGTLLARATDALDPEPDWNVSLFCGIVDGAVEPETVYGAGYRRTGDGEFTLGDDVTLLRRLEVARRIGSSLDVAMSYAPLAQPGFDGEIRFEYQSTQGPIVVSSPMSYFYGGDAILLGGHYRLSLGRTKVGVLVRAGVAAGIAAPDVWRNGERFVRGVRPAAMGTIDVTIAIGSTRVGIAADYLFVGSLELPHAGSRGLPTPFDPSSGSIGLVLGFAL